ncbi:GL14604 [Drosophila persimilis]|uniref:GL14604 n=1 Tax=Drosophila persimilis TaxID=7234 RepID=B4GVU0_DROPE|nr:GL14604 [Drosophila persimilis]
MAPFIRDDNPLVWNQGDQDQDQDQNQDQNPNEEPIAENEQYNELLKLYLDVLKVRASVDQNRVNRLHQRFPAYLSLLIEFANAVYRKLALINQAQTAETVMERSAVSQQIRRQIREICEFADRFMI